MTSGFNMGETKVSRGGTEETNASAKCPVSTTGSSEPPVENPAPTRWLQVRNNPYFREAIDLPASSLSRAQLIAERSQAAQKEEGLTKKYENTSPHGREIIRKNLLAFRKHEQAKEFFKQISALRALVTNYKDMLAQYRGTRTDLWQSNMHATVHGLLRAGRGDEFMNAEIAVRAAFVAVPFREEIAPHQAEVAFWGCLARYMKNSVDGSQRLTNEYSSMELPPDKGSLLTYLGKLINEPKQTQV